MRSKSELIIADMLNKAGVPYKYEYPLRLNGMGKIYPDFTVLNIKKREEIFWEHFGMMDDPTYVEAAIKKILTYEQNGIFPGENLICIYETRKNPINQKVVNSLIENIYICPVKLSSGSCERIIFPFASFNTIDVPAD